MIVTAEGTFTNLSGEYSIWEADELASPVMLELRYDTDWVGDVGGSDGHLEYAEFPIRMTVITSERVVVAQGPWLLGADFEILSNSTRDRITIDLPAESGPYDGSFEWDFFNATNNAKLPVDFSQASFGTDLSDSLEIYMDRDPVAVAFDTSSFVVTTVPEPASLGAFGVAALLTRRRRQTNR